MKALVQARYRLAADKTGKQKKKHSESIGSVVEGVVNRLRPILEAAHFPQNLLLRPVRTWSTSRLKERH